MSVPAAGLLSGGALMGGAFSAAWFSVVVPATFASGGASALFMLPFWLAGGLVVKQTVLDPARATSLSIGDFAWSLGQSVAGQSVSSADGPTEELECAAVEVSAYVNGVPTHVLRLVANGATGPAVYSVGEGLSVAELEWIADEVNAHLQTLEAGRALA